MQKKTILKTFIIFVSLIIFGCGWSSKYEEYSDILDKGIKCEYQNTDPNHGVNVGDIKKITFEGDSDGIYIEYNDSDVRTVISDIKTSEDTYHTDVGSLARTFNYGTFDFQEYLKSYKTYGTCPQNIYLYDTANTEVWVDTMCPSSLNPYDCLTFRYKSTTEEPKGKLCSNPNSSYHGYISNAIVFQSYEIAISMKTSQHVYVEIGYARLADGSISKYYVVGEVDNKENGTVVIGENTLTHGIYDFIFDDSLFLDGEPGTCGFVDDDHFRVWYLDGNERLIFFDYDDGNEPNVSHTEYSRIMVIDPSTTRLGTTSKKFVKRTSYNDNFLENCIDFSPAIKIVGIILLIAKIVIPLVIIVLTSLNLISTVTSGNPEELNKTIKKAAISVLAAIIVFFVPTIVDVMFGVVLDASSSEKENSDIEACRQCLFHPLADDCKKYKLLSEERAYGKTTLEEETIGSKTITTTTKKVTNTGKLVSTYGQGKWIAHQKNSAEKVKKAIDSGFFGIEVDVNQKGSTFLLYHDTNDSDFKTGYTLAEFLQTCKENNILAVLDIKSISNYSDFVKAVKTSGWFENTVFMAGKDEGNNVYKVDKNARLWFLNGNEHNSDQVLAGLEGKFEAVVIHARYIAKEDIELAHKHNMTICPFSYNATMYPQRDAATLRSWGADYLEANEIDEQPR